jgi:hypothetical protein
VPCFEVAGISDWGDEMDVLFGDAAWVELVPVIERFRPGVIVNDAGPLARPSRSSLKRQPRRTSCRLANENRALAASRNTAMAIAERGGVKQADCSPAGRSAAGLLGHRSGLAWYGTSGMANRVEPARVMGHVLSGRRATRPVDLARRLAVRVRDAHGALIGESG